jgi:hypothetical protein
MPLATVFINPESEEPTKIERELVTEGITALLKLPRIDNPDNPDSEPPERWAAYAEVGWDDVLPPVADYSVVSEVSLHAAVMALQSIRLQGRCHYSRTMAKQALQWIGMTGDLPTDPDGMPEPIKSLPGGHHLGTTLSVQNPYGLT